MDKCFAIAQEARVLLALIIALLVIGGCSDDSGSKDAGPDNDGGEDTECDGEIGCECVLEEDCELGLECLEDVCQPEGCEIGLKGCACARGDRCAEDGDGDELQCVDGVCLPGHCSELGENGCPCSTGESCSSVTDICEDGVCITQDCLPGEESCSCLGGGCDPGLLCKEGLVCVDNTGYEGGVCLEDGLCHRGNRCDSFQEVCIHCDLGTEGCHCNDTSTCSEGLRCSGGMCLRRYDIPPVNPVCFYPCENDLILEDGTFGGCDADGLLKGCLPGQKCTGGSCLNEGETKGTCSSDSGCPFYQVCLQGGCYSNCSSSTDCSSGMGCYKKSCRFPCQSRSGGAQCQGGYNCETEDGENGYCTPISLKESEIETPLPSGGMSLEPTHVDFSNIMTSGTFSLTPEGERAQIFTIRKVSHIIYTEKGDPEIVELPRDPETEEYVEDFECDAVKGECPLSWLKIAYDEAPSQAPTLELEALPNCEKIGDGGSGCPVITLSNAGGAPGVRWTGVLEVASKDGRCRDYIQLSYVERPEGQWVGQMYYFGNFSDNGLAAWAASENHNDVSGVDNGLVQKWGAFRSAMLDGWDEFKAVLTSTRTESWKFGEVQKRCQAINLSDANASCYPYSNNEGVRTYVDNNTHNFIPDGLSEMPIAINLKLEGEGAVLSGRIESSIAMHYAGNPAISLEFESDPAEAGSCDPAITTDCAVYLKDMVTNINVGGRFSVGTEDDCDLGYEKLALPWLLPGFQEKISGGYQFHCVDKELPYDISKDDSFARQNISLAWGNPVPNGKPLKRSLRLLDGALINQSEMFILFEESFDSFTSSSGERVSAYGYMILKRQPVDLDPSDENKNGIIDAFEGSTPGVEQKEEPEREGLKCDIGFLKEVLGRDAEDVESLHDLDGVLNIEEPGPDGGPTETGDTINMLDNFVETLITGVSPAQGMVGLESDRTVAGAVVNYFCHDTGMFNAGPNDYLGGDGPRYACPAGSQVDYFVIKDAFKAEFTQQRIAGQTCQSEEKIECFNYGCLTCKEQGCDTDEDDTNDDKYQTSCKERTRCGTEDCSPNIECKLKAGNSCLGTLENWQLESIGIAEAYEPFWKCADSDKVYCDEFEYNTVSGADNLDDTLEFQERLDLRAGKEFYAPVKDSSDRKVMSSLQTAIDDAFRYKTRFVSRSGTVLGFVPAQCIPHSDEIRYCYDPPAIEEIRQRINCLMEVYTDRTLYASLDVGVDEPAPDDGLKTRDRLNQFVRRSYSEFALRRDGFERLYSELLIMLGDEALTSAFATRFDLAGSNTRSFEGTKFEGEDIGINLSGVAGAEMYNLHMAVQYYQLALDRLYESGPNFQEALEREESTDSPTNFISPETVTLYLERLIRASTQRTRSYSEISKSYQNFNEPDLARRVIERAYTSAYLESVVIKELMSSIAEKSERADRPQIKKIVEDALRRYRMAMLDMKDVYSSITDDVNYFGFAPDYIPFPAIDANKTASTNGFEILLATAKQKVAFARQRENYALTSNRNVSTDAETFQAELVRIRNTYENQLADLCGTFKVKDPETGEERIYPAIKKYAEANDVTAMFGDPCGRMSNGAIYNAMAVEEQSLLQDRMIRVKFDNKLANIENERVLVANQCGLTLEQANYVFERAGYIMDLNTGTKSAKVAVDALCGYIEAASSGIKAGISGTAVAAAAAAGPFGAGAAAQLGADALNHGVDAVTKTITTSAQLAYGIAETAIMRQIEDTERTTAKWVTERQCESAIINSNTRTANMLLELKEIQLELLQAVRDSGQKFTEIGRLHNTAKRLQDQQADAEQLLINVQAARNDPNVRIYRNDAIINADVAFDDALRSVYRTTKVFEYYTSQSYARLEQLFLIRMISAGDYNLENYLVQLENEYYDFEEEYGLPDVRVAMLSLRDDIMSIPTTDESKNALSRDERISMMRKRLGSVEMLDSHGYLTVPFSTSIDSMSPLTRNHKIYYIEADIVGSEVGDTIGRLYLRQSGTGVVHNVQDENDYYVFPERTAVLNPFFNGNRVFTTEVYRSHRLRGRPMVNTGWELMINQRDEWANRDIDLQTLSDIRLYVFYTDFTVF